MTADEVVVEVAAAWATSYVTWPIAAWLKDRIRRCGDGQ